MHIIDSMVNQHCKWLEICKHTSWREEIPSLNLLITSTVWRQDHNGFTHQDPGFLDVVMNKSPDVIQIYLPPDVNSPLSVADHCLRSGNYVNVIVSDKQLHLQYMVWMRRLRTVRRGLASGTGPAPTRARNLMWCWRLQGGYPHPGISRCVRAAAGGLPRPEDTVDQCD